MITSVYFQGGNKLWQPGIKNIYCHICLVQAFSGSSAGKEFICNAGDPGSIPELERPAGENRLPTSVFLVFPEGSVGKESACNMGDLGSMSESGRSPGEGNGYPPSILACIIPWALQSRGSQSQTQLSNFHLLTHLFSYFFHDKNVLAYYSYDLKKIHELK